MLPDRKTAPAFVKSTDFSLIKPQTGRLGNGIDIFFIRGGSQDVIKVELLFHAGKWFDSKWGQSYFTSHQISKGTSSKTSFEIAQIFDRYGAHLEVSSGLDLVSVSLYSLTKNLQHVLGLLKEVLLDPVFPEKEFAQAQQIYIQNLKVNLEKTSFLASRHFRKLMFGEAHPYGNDLEENDILSLGRQDLKDFFPEFFRYFSVFVSGNFDARDEARITDAFSSWDVKKPADKNIETQTGLPFTQQLDKEGSVQASIRVGKRSLVRSHPDYVKAIFVSHV